MMDVFVTAIAHKCLELVALLAAPQFDTSNTLLIDDDQSIKATLARRLMVWDSVHYCALAQRGVQYEHEYAFWNLWPKIIRFVCPTTSLVDLSLTSAGLSFCAHLCAVVIFYYLTKSTHQDSARNAATAYLLSPAGLFLVGGYPESAFALACFLGIFLFRRKYRVFAGAVFGFATLLRSNGLLWGSLFAVDFLRKPTMGTFVGGSFIAVAFIWPQFKAYLQWCPGRPWCESTIPFIYSYVQSHYWNVGFLRYWTFNNIPNFLFGLPTILILLLSLPGQPLDLQLVQGAILVGAIFFWHVQILTRIASCLPGPYWYIARGNRRWLLYFSAWTLSQAVLYGSFLPPA